MLQGEIQVDSNNAWVMLRAFAEKWKDHPDEHNANRVLAWKILGGKSSIDYLLAEYDRVFAWPFVCGLVGLDSSSFQDVAVDSQITSVKIPRAISLPSAMELGIGSKNSASAEPEVIPNPLQLSRRVRVASASADSRKITLPGAEQSVVASGLKEEVAPLLNRSGKPLEAAASTRTTKRIPLVSPFPHLSGKELVITSPESPVVVSSDVRRWASPPPVPLFRSRSLPPVNQTENPLGVSGTGIADSARFQSSRLPSGRPSVVNPFRAAGITSLKKVDSLRAAEKS